MTTDRPRVRGIDIHTHVVPAVLPGNPLNGYDPRWPSISCGAHGNYTVIIRERPFRTVGSNGWDPARRIEEMDAASLGMQVLSPMPELLSYWLETEQTATLARHLNATIAAMVAQAPTRFCGLGTVTMQDPERAAREISLLRREFEFVGVEAGSNVNGIPLGNPRFDPVFAALVESDLCLFVHALHPTRERICGPPSMEALAGFPCEVGLAAVSFIANGVLDKFPTLRVAFSHGGGVLPMLLPRLEHGWSVAEDVRRSIRRSPTEQAAGFFYDTLVFSKPALEFLLATYGAGQLMLGSDYPFLLQDAAPVASTLNAGLDATTVAAICTVNAQNFLRLSRQR